MIASSSTFKLCSSCGEEITISGQHCTLCGDPAALAPSKLQIRAACLEIQRGWAPNDEWNRRCQKSVWDGIVRGKKVSDGRRKYSEHRD